jgi:hypothetical protein
VPLEWQSGFLKCDIRLGAGDERKMKVLYHTPEKRTYHYRRSWNFHLRVLARRMLSDMRDNYLSKSDQMLTAAEKVKDGLLMTASPRRIRDCAAIQMDGVDGDR